MKRVEGFVLITTPEGAKGRVMIGPAPLEGGNPYQNFKKNGLTPFDNRKDAEEAFKFLSHNPDFHRPALRQIALDIAQSEEEAEELFSSDRSLVIILHEDHGVEFIGKSTYYGTRIDSLPGNILETNGFKPFNTFRRVSDSASEIREITHKDVDIARFKLGGAGKAA